MESSQRPCTGPGTESVSQTRAAAQNRLLAVPFQQDIAFMHIHVANDHYRHASQTTKSSCGAPTADRRVSEAATGPRSQLPGGRYVHGVEVTARIRQWRRMDGNGVRVSLGKAVAAPDSMMDAEKLTRWQGSSSGATGKEKHEAFHKRRAAVTAASRFARPRRAPTRQSVHGGPSLHVGAVCGALQAVAAANGNAARRWHPEQSIRASTGAAQRAQPSSQGVMYGSAAHVRGRSKHLGHVGTAQAAGRAHGAALHGRDGGALAPAAIHACPM